MNTPLRKVILPDNVITNDDVVKRAQQLAKAEGGTWSSRLDKAQHQLESELAERRKAAKPSAPIDDADLRKAAIAAELRRFAGAGPRRIVIGEIDAPKVGRLFVEHDQGSDEVIVHDVRIKLGDVDKDLRDTFCACAAAFNRAQDQQEQVTQRALVGLVVAAIIERHDKIGTKVKGRMVDVRYGV